MLSLLRFFKPYIWQSLVLFFAVAVQVWSGVTLPALMAEIVNKGIVIQDIDLIWRTGALMIGCAGVGALGALVSSYFSSMIGASIAKDLRNEIFEKILSFSVYDFYKFSTASLITRTTNDISRVSNTLRRMLSMMLRAPMMAIGAIFQAIATAPDMTWIIILAVSVIALISISILYPTMPKFRLYQKIVDKITMLTRENLTGVRVIRAFNNQNYEEKKFNRTNQKLMKTDLFIERMMAFWDPIISLVFNGIAVLCVWYGVSRMGENIGYLGNMMAFMQYVIQVVMSFLFLTILFVNLPRANVSAKRINEVLKTNPRIKWKEMTKGVKYDNPLVEFRKVGFKYENAEENVLKDISFVARPGEITAIIGSTGSGKSTLVNLMMRFQEVTDGEVIVNGLNVKEYSKKDLMSKIGYVPQKSFLFSGTIEENVGFGMEEKSDEVIKDAVRKAQAKEFVEKKDKKYKFKVSQGGTNLSGGQKQRLAIARAIAKRPEILVFDDSFSALDMKTDEKLRRELKNISQNSVIVIVGQRINTIKNADQIIVLENGRIVGKGKHLELMKRSKVYQEIAKSQMSEEEYIQQGGIK